MQRLGKIWNGRIGGVPSALLLALSVVYGRIGDWISTSLWRGNLAALGTGSRIQRSVTIRFPGRVRIGRDCCVGSFSSFTSEHADADLVIGDNATINPHVFLDFSGGLMIGKNVLISRNVTVFTHSHGYDPKSEARKMPLRIDDNVWVGANVIIGEAVSWIAAGSIIGTGSVVTRDITEKGIYAGVPASLKKSLPSATEVSKAGLSR